MMAVAQLKKIATDVGLLWMPEKEGIRGTRELLEARGLGVEARTTKFNLNKQTNNRRRSDPKGTIGGDVPCPGTTPLEVAVLKGHTAIADLGEETVRQNQQDPQEPCSNAIFILQSSCFLLCCFFEWHDWHIKYTFNAHQNVLPF